MGRTAKSKELKSTESGFNEDRLAEADQAMVELTRMNAEASENACALAAQLGYVGVLTVGAVEDSIRFYQHRSVEAVLELGKSLIILRELTPHGEFSKRLEMLDISDRMAQKFMASTLKFSNANSSSLLKAAGTQTKMLELLALDDGEIEALGSGESVRGLNLDAIETMSVRELKAALRESQANASATDKVLGDLQTANTKLKKQLSREIDPQAEWSDAMHSLNVHVAAHRSAFLESITALDVIREKVMQQEAEPGAEAALAAAREQIGRELAEAIERAEELVSKVRRLFDCTLGALIG